jgi:hypothetical protein
MARELLRAGITTVRDVGSFADEAIVLCSAVELGLMGGPRILSCGRIISAPPLVACSSGRCTARLTGPPGRAGPTTRSHSDDSLGKDIRQAPKPTVALDPKRNRPLPHGLRDLGKTHAHILMRRVMCE